MAVSWGLYSAVALSAQPRGERTRRSQAAIAPTCATTGRNKRGQPRGCPHCSHAPCCPANEVDDEEDHKQRQQNVDRPYRHMESEIADQPCDQKQYRNCQPHTEPLSRKRQAGASPESDGGRKRRFALRLRGPWFSLPRRVASSTVPEQPPEPSAVPHRAAKHPFRRP